MRSGQGKGGVLFVVERRTTPVRCRVTGTTAGRAVRLVELTGMDVLVATGAGRWRFPESHLADAGFRRARPVAV
jgi:hypothetical protein